jgi:hypothetical protein
MEPSQIDDIVSRALGSDRQRKRRQERHGGGLRQHAERLFHRLSPHIFEMLPMQCKSGNGNKTITCYKFIFEKVTNKDRLSEDAAS